MTRERHRLGIFSSLEDVRCHGHDGEGELFLPEDHVNLEQVKWDEDTVECLQHDQILGRDVPNSYSTPSVIYNTSRCRTIRSAKSASCSACERTEWRWLPSMSSLHGQHH
eukprot:scaffold128_cov248-Pinguiococcus_pyrenoidosus.AAC.14